MLLLLSALALLLAGGAIIAYSARMRRKALAQRVALVRPPLPAEGTAKDQPVFRPPAGTAHATELREIGRLLVRIRVAPERAAAVMTAARVVAAIASGILAVVAAEKLGLLAPHSMATLGLAFGAVLAGWFAVPWLLRRGVKKRVGRIEVGLAEAIELLVVCVEAGLSLEDGIERVVAELGRARPELAEELALTSADLKILSDRDQALFNLAERLNLASVRSFVTTLAQTLRYGTPLAQALRSVASDLRNDALLRLEERANRLPVLMTLPLMLFIMPTIFLIVAGPAALRLLDAFHR